MQNNKFEDLIQKSWMTQLPKNHLITLIFRHKNLGYPPLFVIHVLHIPMVLIIDSKAVKYQF